MTRSYDVEMDGIHGTLVLVNELLHLFVEPLLMYVEPMMKHSVVELMSMWIMVSPFNIFDDANL